MFSVVTYSHASTFIHPYLTHRLSSFFIPYYTNNFCSPFDALLCVEVVKDIFGAVVFSSFSSLSLCDLRENFETECVRLHPFPPAAHVDQANMFVRIINSHGGRHFCSFFLREAKQITKKNLLCLKITTKKKAKERVVDEIQSRCSIKRDYL